MSVLQAVGFGSVCVAALAIGVAVLEDVFSERSVRNVAVTSARVPVGSNVLKGASSAARSGRRLYEASPRKARARAGIP